MRLGEPDGTAEELAQETLLAVWHKANYFDPARASASTWIFTIARNLRIDAKRRRRDPRALFGALDLAPVPLASDGVLLSERVARLRVALENLPHDQAEVIKLSFFEDRPHSEIAELLKIPLGTVKSRVRIAYGRLRLLMEDLQ
jgi:RNA polymerase sigma-70 factor (ECF subfamily)